MSASIQNPADITNLALRRLGWKLRVGNLFDGSRAANYALDLYAQTRDAVLRGGDWPFAKRNVLGTLLKQAPAGGYIPPTTWTSAYPPQPWMFEYGYPDDALDIKAVKPQVLFVPNFDPQPYLFAIANDNGYSPARRVLLSNVADALIAYTGQVTDPATWPPDFIEDFAANLAERLAPNLANMDVAKLEAADANLSDAKAQTKQG